MKVACHHHQPTRKLVLSPSCNHNDKSAGSDIRLLPMPQMLFQFRIRLYPTEKFQRRFLVKKKKKRCVCWNRVNTVIIDCALPFFLETWPCAGRKLVFLARGSRSSVHPWPPSTAKADAAAIGVMIGGVKISR